MCGLPHKRMILRTLHRLSVGDAGVERGQAFDGLLPRPTHPEPAGDGAEKVIAIAAIAHGPQPLDVAGLVRRGRYAGGDMWPAVAQTLSCVGVTGGAGRRVEPLLVL